DRGFGLLSHAAAQALGRGLFEGGGIDDAESEIAEMRLALAPIARDPGKVIHQCETPPDEAIEQRRLADVGPSDNGDGEAHDRRPYAVHAAMSSGCDERNQRVGGGSGQATPPPEGCGDPGRARVAAGRCCCGAGGSGHWTWD